MRLAIVDLGRCEAVVVRATSLSVDVCRAHILVVHRYDVPVVATDVSLLVLVRVLQC